MGRRESRLPSFGTAGVQTSASYRPVAHCAGVWGPCFLGRVSPRTRTRVHTCVHVQHAHLGVCTLAWSSTPHFLGVPSVPVCLGRQTPEVRVLAPSCPLTCAPRRAAEVSAFLCFLRWFVFLGGGGQNWLCAGAPHVQGPPASDSSEARGPPHPPHAPPLLPYLCLKTLTFAWGERTNLLRLSPDGGGLL